MDSKVVIRHLNSSRANQLEEFPLAQSAEFVIGRDPSCTVRYDPNQDLISRLHAKITVDKRGPLEFNLVDLNSRNGTFLNRQRIFGSARILPGDTVQLGVGGPEFQFDVEPKPEDMVRPTRLATLDGAQSSPVVPTRQVQAPNQPAGSSSFPTRVPAGTSSSGMVGRATVERMIAQVTSQSRRTSAVASAIILVILAIGFSGFALIRHERLASQPVVMTPADISKTYAASTMYVQAAWKLYYMGSGRQLFQLYEPNRTIKDENGSHRFVNTPEDYVPVFVQANGVVAPLLTTSPGGGHNKAIGEILSGTGFAVSSDGFIITNRHVAAPWTLPYEWSADDRGGMLLAIDANGNKTLTAISRDQFPDNWIPSKAQFIDEGSKIDSIRKSAFAETKPVEGRNDFLDVTPAMNRIRTAARLVRVSDRADVALLRIDVPQPLRPIVMNSNAGSIHRGDSVCTLGYPDASPELIGVTSAETAQNTGAEVKSIPDVTISVGNIGRIIHDMRGANESVYSRIGDVYQLTINSTGHGNSGGPLLDEHGQAIGIFTYGKYDPGDASLTFAVPIKYALDLVNGAGE